MLSDNSRLQLTKQLVAEQLQEAPLTGDHTAAFVASLSASHEASTTPLSASSLRAAHDGLAAAVKKAGGKCAVQLGGYHALHAKLRQEVAELEAQLAEKRRERECYSVLQTREEAAIDRRMREGLDALNAMKQREAAMQEEFREWMVRQQSQQSQHSPPGAVSVNG